MQYLKVFSLAGAICLGSAMTAQAELIATLEGSDCAGVFSGAGTGEGGFGTCAIPDEFDPDNTPVIIKFNANGTVSEINTALFPTIDGSEFSFVFDSSTTGSWTYTPDAEDPATLVSFFVAKGGDAFNLFSNDPIDNTDSWFTPNGAGLSHLTFYEGGAPVIPEPGSLMLLGTGLVFGARRLRKRFTA